MPVDIRNLDGGIGNMIVGHGVLTGPEYVRTHTAHLSQDADTFKRYRYSLADYTGVERVEVPSSDIRLVADLCREVARLHPKVVVAVIADSDIAFGLCRMWEILVDEIHWEVMVFRERDEAMVWIRRILRETYGVEDVTFR